MHELPIVDRVKRALQVELEKGYNAVIILGRIDGVSKELRGELYRAGFAVAYLGLREHTISFSDIS